MQDSGSYGDIGIFVKTLAEGGAAHRVSIHTCTSTCLSVVDHPVPNGILLTCACTQGLRGFINPSLCHLECLASFRMGESKLGIRLYL